MSFPVSGQTPADALAEIRRTASAAKEQVQTLRDASVAGDTERRRYVRLQEALSQAIASWDADAATPGLSVYAQEQFNDGTFNIIAEYTTMRNAAEVLRDWIFSNIPTHAPSGGALLYTLNQDGSTSNMVFTTAQTAGFRTECDAFLATVS